MSSRAPKKTSSKSLDNVSKNSGKVPKNSGYGSTRASAQALPGIELERDFWASGLSVGGVDEVGRGCLAGPVVAAVACLPEIESLESAPSWIREVRDSKLVPQPKREELAALLKDWLVDYAVGEASVEEIDRHNILQATFMAMNRAVSGLQVAPQKLLFDGKLVPAFAKQNGQAIVKGDLKILSIACASIIAKVYRDELVSGYDSRYPNYGFSVHKGYGTPAHLNSLTQFGVIRGVHRVSFSPVRNALGIGVTLALPLE